jgi:hypothetical protein
LLAPFFQDAATVRPPVRPVTPPACQQLGVEGRIVAKEARPSLEDAIDNRAVGGLKIDQVPGPI